MRLYSSWRNFGSSLLDFIITSETGSFFARAASGTILAVLGYIVPFVLRLDYSWRKWSVLGTNLVVPGTVLVIPSETELFLARLVLF